jgi:hypothetical protein
MLSKSNGHVNDQNMLLKSNGHVSGRNMLLKNNNVIVHMYEFTFVGFSYKYKTFRNARTLNT